MRVTVGGTYYLDARWHREGLVAEVNGTHHYVGVNPTYDALRANELAFEGYVVIMIPRIAMRVAPDPFFAQIERYLNRFDAG